MTRMISRAALCMGLALSATAPVRAQISDYKSLSALRDRFPPDGFINTQIFSTTGWNTLDVTNAAQVGAGNVILPNTPATDAATKIEAILASTSGNRILSFPAGVYYFGTHLSITQSNVFIQGAGLTNTEFRITAPDNLNAEIEFTGGGLSATEIDVTGAPQRGATTITVGDASTLAVGDTIHLYDKALGPTNGFYHYGQMAEITAKSGNVLTLSPSVSLTYAAAGDPKVKEVNVIQNVGIRGVHVSRTNQPTSDFTNNIEFVYANNAFAREVESSNLGRGGIVAYFSIDAVIISSFVHDAFAYGGGGQAYGILLTNNTTRSRVTDNKVWNMRHHIILQRGANNSVVSLNSAEPPYNGVPGDLSIHGFTVHNTLFEQNMGRTLEQDERSDVNAEQYQGLYNTAYRNNLSAYASSNIQIAGPNTTGNFPNQSATVLGNITAAMTVASSAVDPWVGANRVNGTVAMGDAPGGWWWPASLYTETAPSYFGTKAWPIFGPGVGTNSNFGAPNTLPAYDRAKP